MQKRVHEASGGELSDSADTLTRTPASPPAAAHTLGGGPSPQSHSDAGGAPLGTCSQGRHTALGCKPVAAQAAHTVDFTGSCREPHAREACEVAV